MTRRIDDFVDEHYPEYTGRQKIRMHCLARVIIDTAKAEMRAELAPAIHYAQKAPQGDAARPEAAPVARVTCQCREPEPYIPGGTWDNLDTRVICNQCGYEFDPEVLDKLPPRVSKRDFGPHLCFCIWINTKDGRTCLDCGGHFYPYPTEMAWDLAPSVMCG